MTRPETVFIRRGELVRWLEGYGISLWKIRRLISDGKIESRKIQQQGRAYFVVEQVEERVLRPLMKEKNDDK